MDMADSGSLKVEKRDGSLQPFDRSKVIDSCVKAGASSDQAEMIASRVEEWCGSNSSGTVKSVTIREKVLETLHLENPSAGKNYESYNKPADL